MKDEEEVCRFDGFDFEEWLEGEGTSHNEAAHKTIEALQTVTEVMGRSEQFWRSAASEAVARRNEVEGFADEHRELRLKTDEAYRETLIELASLKRIADEVYSAFLVYQWSGTRDGKMRVRPDAWELPAAVEDLGKALGREGPERAGQAMTEAIREAPLPSALEETARQLVRDRAASTGEGIPEAARGTVRGFYPPDEPPPPYRSWHFSYVPPRMRTVPKTGKDGEVRVVAGPKDVWVSGRRHRTTVRATRMPTRWWPFLRLFYRVECLVCGKKWAPLEDRLMAWKDAERLGGEECSDEPSD